MRDTAAGLGSRLRGEGLELGPPCEVSGGPTCRELPASRVAMEPLERAKESGQGRCPTGQLSAEIPPERRARES